MKISSDLGRAFTRVQMKMQLEELEGFIKSVESAFKKQLKASERKWDKAPEGLDDDELEAYYHKCTMDAHSFRSGFPDLVRRTTFIHLYSVLEKALLRLCESLHDRAPNLASPSENRKDKGIVKAQKYIKEAGIEFPDQNPDWEEICRMNELRNRLVHSIGVRSLPTSLEEYCKRKKNQLKLGYHGSITIKEGYCQHAIDVVRRFYHSLIAAIPDQYFESEWRTTEVSKEE